MTLPAPEPAASKKTAAKPRLEIRGARKRYGGVHALRGVDLTIAPGEIHALIGENGAGKSTLMKVLSGAVLPDNGQMVLDGKPYSPTGPRDARASGVAMIYQELNLCPDLSVLENVTLGHEKTVLGWALQGAAAARLAGILESLGVTSFGPRSRVSGLGPGDRQLVEIARALFAEASVIVFDEPTSSLSPPDVKRLFEAAWRLSERGVSIVWISHFLDEVTELCERYTVLRDGESVGCGDVAGTTVDQLISQMVGRSLDDVYPRSERPQKPSDPVLSVRGLTGQSGFPAPLSFDLGPGEILGVFGLVGAGRTEMLRALFGLDPAAGGEVTLHGRAAPPRSPGGWLREGMGLLSEDRATEGLFLDLSLADNATASKLGPLRRPARGPIGFVTPAARRGAFSTWQGRLGIRASSPDQPARTLSGGNQQKVAIARLLHHGVSVFLLDEPTRGIDVGAKIEVYRLLDELCRMGNSILMVSSYLPELFGVADRIAVMSRGVLGAARATGDWTEDEVLAEAAGGTLHA